MDSVSQTPDDLMRHLSDQIAFMLASAKSFDEGNIGEGKRLAVNIRLLLYDTDKSRSLLGQLSIKSNMGFYDTAKRMTPGDFNLIPPLLQMTMGPAGAGFQPLLDSILPNDPPKKVLFDAWWEGVVLPIQVGAGFTRRDLVLAVANKDGGAHVDPELDKRYVEVSRYNALGWTINVDGEEKNFEDPVLMSLRQIAHELLMSLKDEFSHLFPQQPPMRSRPGDESSVIVDEAYVCFSKRA